MQALRIAQKALVAAALSLGISSAHAAGGDLNYEARIGRSTASSVHLMPPAPSVDIRCTGKYVLAAIP